MLLKQGLCRILVFFAVTKFLFSHTLFEILVVLHGCELDSYGEEQCDLGLWEKCRPGPAHKCTCCPECKGPLAKKIHYCARKSASGGSSGTSSGSGSSGSVSERSGVSGQGQNGNRRFNPFWYIVGAASVATVIGAVLWKKRVSI